MSRLYGLGCNMRASPRAFGSGRFLGTIRPSRNRCDKSLLRLLATRRRAPRLRSRHHIGQTPRLLCPSRPAHCPSSRPNNRRRRNGSVGHDCLHTRHSERVQRRHCPQKHQPAYLKPCNNRPARCRSHARRRSEYTRHHICLFARQAGHHKSRVKQCVHCSSRLKRGVLSQQERHTDQRRDRNRHRKRQKASSSSPHENMKCPSAIAGFVPCSTPFSLNFHVANAHIHLQQEERAGLQRLVSHLRHPSVLAARRY